MREGVTVLQGTIFIKVTRFSHNYASDCRYMCICACMTCVRHVIVSFRLLGIIQSLNASTPMSFPPNANSTK